MSKIDLSKEVQQKRMEKLEEDFAILHCSKAEIDNLSRITGIKFLSLYSDERIGIWINAREYDNYWHEYNEHLFMPYLNEALKERREKRGFE